MLEPKHAVKNEVVDASLTQTARDEMISAGDRLADAEVHEWCAGIAVAFEVGDFGEDAMTRAVAFRDMAEQPLARAKVHASKVSGDGMAKVQEAVNTYLLEVLPQWLGAVEQEYWTHLAKAEVCDELGDVEQAEKHRQAALHNEGSILVGERRLEAAKAESPKHKAVIEERERNAAAAAAKAAELVAAVEAAKVAEAKDDAWIEPPPDVKPKKG